MFRLLYLGNGWADCVEIWHELGDPLVTDYAIVTCARAEIPPHRASVSRKRLGRLCSNLVCGLGSLTKCLPQVIDGLHLHVRTPFPQMFRLLFLGNGWADYVEIWYALGSLLATAYAVVTDGVSLHVRTCTPCFCISQTARPVAFKFGVRVSSHYLSAFHKSWVEYLCTCARADRASVSQERLGRLSSILVCELGVMNYVLNTFMGEVSLHVRTCTPRFCISGTA